MNGRIAMAVIMLIGSVLSLFNCAYATPKRKISGISIHSGELQSSQSSDEQRRGSELARESKPIRTTLCELVKNPELFNGQLVEVRADVFNWFESSLLVDKTCKREGRLPVRIWLEFKDVPISTRVLVNPQKDAEYRRFWTLMTSETRSKNKHAYSTSPKFTVTATIIGRFDHSVRAADAAGFGTGGWNSELVLKSVNNVVARPFDKELFSDANLDR